MHKGVLSDDYIRKQNPAFFFDTWKTRKPGIKKSLMPYYDIFSVAQVTQQNVYAGASEMVLNYVPPIPLPVPVPQQVDPFSPAASPASTVDNSSRYVPYDPNNNPFLDIPQAPSFLDQTTPSKALQNAMKKLQIDAVGSMSTPDGFNIYTQHKGMMYEHEDLESLDE